MKNTFVNVHRHAFLYHISCSCSCNNTLRRLWNVTHLRVFLPFLHCNIRGQVQCGVGVSALCSPSQQEKRWSRNSLAQRTLLQSRARFQHTDDYVSFPSFWRTLQPADEYPLPLFQLSGHSSLCLLHTLLNSLHYWLLLLLHPHPPSSPTRQLSVVPKSGWKRRSAVPGPIEPTPLRRRPGSPQVGAARTALVLALWEAQLELEAAGGQCRAAAWICSRSMRVGGSWKEYWVNTPTWSKAGRTGRRTDEAGGGDVHRWLSVHA